MLQLLRGTLESTSDVYSDVVFSVVRLSQCNNKHYLVVCIAV
jgi:hypothetical protein